MEFQGRFIGIMQWLLSKTKPVDVIEKFAPSSKKAKIFSNFFKL